MYETYGCGCGSGARNFPTRAEKIEMLREYKEALEKEIQGVSEKIKDLEKIRAESIFYFFLFFPITIII